MRTVKAVIGIVLALATAAAWGTAIVPVAHAQLPGSNPRAAAIKEDVRSILSGPDYLDRVPEESILQKAGKFVKEKWDAFWQWLEQLFRMGGRANPATAQFFIWIVLGLLIIAIAYVIAYAFRRLGWGTGRLRAPKRALHHLEEELEEALSDPDSLLLAARELAAAGDFRRAYRAVFLALLRRLDRAGLIRFDRSATNGEYLHALRSRPELFTSVRPMTEDFDKRWYGGHPVDDPDYRRMISAYETLFAQVEQP